MASTEVKDRSGDKVLASSFIKGLENFQKNPVLLFSHDLTKAIGKVIEARIFPGEGLEVVAEISKSADESIRKLIEDRTYKAFSIGFKRLKDSMEDDILVVEELELLEISVVSVPANQDTIFEVIESEVNQLEQTQE